MFHLMLVLTVGRHVWQVTQMVDSHTGLSAKYVNHMSEHAVTVALSRIFLATTRRQYKVELICLTTV